MQIDANKLTLKGEKIILKQTHCTVSKQTFQNYVHVNICFDLIST